MWLWSAFEIIYRLLEWRDPFSNLLHFYMWILDSSHICLFSYDVSFYSLLCSFTVSLSKLCYFMLSKYFFFKHIMFLFLVQCFLFIYMQKFASPGSVLLVLSIFLVKVMIFNGLINVLFRCRYTRSMQTILALSL